MSFRRMDLVQDMGALVDLRQMEFLVDFCTALLQSQMILVLVAVILVMVDLVVAP